MVKELEPPPESANSQRLALIRSPPSTAKPTESTKLSTSLKTQRDAAKVPEETAEEIMQRERDSLAKGKFVNLAKIVMLVNCNHFQPTFCIRIKLHCDSLLAISGSSSSTQRTNRQRIDLLHSISGNLYRRNLDSA